MSYLVRSSLFSGFNSLVSELGGDPSALLANFGLSPELSEQVEQFVSFRSVVALFEHCADGLKCPDFGIQLARRQGLQMLGPVAVLVRNTKTVESAFEAIARYIHVIAPAVRIALERKRSGDITQLTISLTEAGLVRSRQILEMLMGNGTLIGQMLTGERVHAHRMYFPHARLASSGLYRSAYGCEVWFEQDQCAVDIPNSLMRLQVVGADRETERVAREYLESKHDFRQDDLEPQIRNLIERLLPTGQCTLETIAQALGHQPRTLQRRLARQELHFADLIDEERKRLAELHLSKPEMRLTQIVGLLGYADQSTLNRACRRWFQASPKKIRSTILKD